MNLLVPATEMLAALHRREIGAIELLDLHLKRIERYNPELNAIILIDGQGARAAAAAADHRRAGGEDLPLLGLPMTIKDAIDVAGLPTTAGLAWRRDVRPDRDALVVRRVRKAGAVLIGKTNVPSWVADMQTDNPLFGRTNNPWNLARTPGGSTGGGAAAVATGLSPLELGSDIGGSIRVPAAFCGIYGHRPSETAVPRSGHFPGYALPVAGALLNVLGPLARSAADLELALDVITGPDVGEDVAWRLGLPPPRHDHLRDFRVAILQEISWQPVDMEIARALRVLAERLREIGVRVEETQPEAFGDLRDHHLLYATLLATMFNFNAGRSEKSRRREAEELLASDDEFEVARSRGLLASAHELLENELRREGYRASYREFFRSWDVLLAPVTLAPAFPHNNREEGRTIIVNGEPVPYMRQMVYPALATLSGQPATVFPTGLSDGGLPIGLQAIGPYLEDRTPIRFASLLAEAFGGYQPPPAYAPSSSTQ